LIYCLYYHTNFFSFGSRDTRVPSITMARKYLGGSGESLTVWISIAASTVLIFYGYDQVSATPIALCLTLQSKY
jgi:hypothetical protein